MNGHKNGTPLTVAVVSRKGGASKTTTAFNVAGVWAQQGQQVLLVDLDPQASLTGLLLGERSSRGVSSALLDPQADLQGLVQPYGGELFSSLFIVPGDRGIERAALELSDRPTGFYRLRKLLAPLTQYDAVIIDTPPGLGFAITSALIAAHIAVIPTMTGQLDLDALTDTVALVEEQEEIKGARLVAIVPSAVRGREVHDRTAVQALTAAYGDLVTDSIPYTTRLREAMVAREPIMTYEPQSPATLAYISLAQRLMNEGGPRG